MSYRSGGGTGGGLARFACEHCRRQKLKCSRELPKCRACQPWPSSCDYARDASPPRPRKAARRTGPVPETAPNENHNHLSQGAFVGPKVALSRSERETGPAREPNPTADTGASASQATRPPRQVFSSRASGSDKDHSSFSFLREATFDLNKASSLADPTSREHAQTELKTLHTSLAMDAKVNGEVEQPSKTYNVPSRAAAYAYMSRFVAASSMGHLFLQEPTDDCLWQVLFDPSTVKQKAWVVFVNYLLLGMVSTEPGRSDEATKLRSNVHLALNDSSIFLTPSLVNVQTLALLAIHGEDFASPSQSWMLVGHACRQAEALALHEPASADSVAEQRRLSLFWLLFVIDKGCSLAFGRPPTLPTSTYGHTPGPTHQYLASHCPHLSEAYDSRSQYHISHFGARFYLSGFELSKLIGLVLEAEDVKAEKRYLRQQLEEWYRASHAELSAAMEAEADGTNAAQRKEMSLGLRSFKFQYLHLLIILLKYDVNHAALRIASAREALLLLPDMVSNWGSVYNGIVWQLLYLPFGPFFVIFGNILSDPTAWTAETDLQHLRTTKTYFESMRNQLSLLSTLASRLAKTAGVFVQLAEHHVNASAPSTAAGATTQGLDDLSDIDLAAIEGYLEWLPGSVPPTQEIMEPEAAVDGDGEATALNGRKRRFDDVFDWFSWDSYYSGIGT